MDRPSEVLAVPLKAQVKMVIQALAAPVAVEIRGAILDFDGLRLKKYIDEKSLTHLDVPQVDEHSI